MTTRTHDGSAGDVDYGAIGSGYSGYRRPDPRIAQAIAEALHDARTVLNVGAGTGSYESAARSVTAVEPSESMRARRPARLARAVDAVAEDLPFADGEFDAAMALFSVHQWSDAAAGLREMRRVTRGPVVVLTCDPKLVRDFWLLDHWDTLLRAHRDQAIGRRNADGAPLTGGAETTPADLDAARPDGVPFIATNAHIRLAAPATTGGATPGTYIGQALLDS
ncbi:methyltransferase domain-containing protein [Streptomyces sp. NBC_01546]|uniref:class I SAM-dependent methyltransferase n=1 Tax=Streptomyces sp. NBC_01546 TaxID=2975872 RepID=UPI00386E8A8D